MNKHICLTEHDIFQMNFYFLCKKLIMHQQMGCRVLKKL